MQYIQEYINTEEYIKIYSNTSEYIRIHQNNTSEYNNTLKHTKTQSFGWHIDTKHVIQTFKTPLVSCMFMYYGSFRRKWIF